MGDADLPEVMGSQNSSLRKTLEEEFSRLASRGEKHLTIEQLLHLRLPPSPWNLDPTHLGVLWILDRFILAQKIGGSALP